MKNQYILILLVILMALCIFIGYKCSLYKNEYLMFNKNDEESIDEIEKYKSAIKKILSMVPDDVIVDICKDNISYDIKFYEYSGDDRVDCPMNEDQTVFVTGESFEVVLSTYINDLYLIFVEAGYKEGKYSGRVETSEKNYISVNQYNDYTVDYAEGGLTGSSIKYTFKNFNTNDEIELRLNDELANRLNLKNPLIKVLHCK